MYQLKKWGGISNSLLAPPLCTGLSLFFSFSLLLFLSFSQIRLKFTETLLYLHFKRNISNLRLFVKNNIDTSLPICTLYYIFGTKRLSSDFQYSQCFDKNELNSTFQDKICRKSFYGVCCMRTRRTVTILWCNNIRVILQK